MRIRDLALATVLLVLSLPTTAFALWAEPPERAPWAMFSSLSLTIGYQHLTLTDPLAQAHGLGTAAGGVNVAFGARLWRLLSVNLAFGGLSTSDRAPFTNTTITCPISSPCNDRSHGVIEDMMSDAGAFSITASAGLGPPPIAVGHFYIAGSVNLGTISADFSRSIDECHDCTYDSLMTVASGFIELNTLVGVISESAPGEIGDFAFLCGLSAGYRHYLNREKLVNGWSLGVAVGGTIGDTVWRPTFPQ